MRGSGLGYDLIPRVLVSYGEGCQGGDEDETAAHVVAFVHEAASLALVNKLAQVALRLH